MIAQARITSDTSATVHLAAGSIDLSGPDLPAVRAQVKDLFIAAAREADGSLDVVIVEPDVHHHLRVEPSGRITGREADGRPTYGPDVEPPVTGGLPPVESPGPLGSPATGEHAAVGDDAADEHRRHRARRRRTLATSTGSATSGPTPLSAASAAPAGEDDTPSSPAPQLRPDWAPAVSPGPVGRADRSPLSPPAEGPEHGPGSTDGGLVDQGPVDRAPVDQGPVDPAPSGRSGADAGPAGRSALAPMRPSRPAPDDGRPTLEDLRRSTSRAPRVKATRGWRRTLSVLTAGVISPGPGRKERASIDRLARIRRPLEGPRNIAVVNLKGGAHKTTASLMIAATLGVSRGGNVLAWDNNETRGTLGWRGIPSDHHRTAVDLLHDIERLRSSEASSADLDPYVRPQGGMRFDILASDEDPGSMASIDEHAFGELNDTLSRFYRIKVIDTGNNVRASNWLAAVKDADQLVIVSTVREDTFNAAAWMIDELRATGLASQVDHAVTILSHSSKGKFDPVLRQRLLAHFGSHTRGVAEVPYEQQFVDGSHLDWAKVSPATKEAWMDATALIIDGL